VREPARAVRPVATGRPRRPRVVHVITRLVMGGAQLSVLALCEQLAGDFDLRIVCGPQTGAEGSLQHSAAALAPLTVVSALRREISPRWDPVAVPALRRTLDRLDPDIVHTHSSKAGIVGRLAAAPLRARVVHTVHGWGHTPSDRAWTRRSFIALERIAANRCDALVAVSSDIRDEGLELGIGRAALYRVIANTVALDPIDPDFAESRRRAREALGLDPGAEVIGWVGRFVPQKDPGTLGQVVTTMLRARPASRAVLVGDGPQRARVEAALVAAGVGDRVLLTGVRPGARELMPAFDVLIHPSRWEGQPRVIQEALAERVPVVSARASGVRELVRDGSTGFVVAPGAPRGMAAAATAVLDDPALRAPLPDSAIAGLRARFGLEPTAGRYRALYEELLS
jgi:glycosyltransferase involved in cell wall biosynthesis